jgi:protein phosphatase 1B
LFLCDLYTGHAGTGVAEYTSTMLRGAIEESAAWQEYILLAAPARAKPGGMDLLSAALVQAYVAIDVDLRDIDSMDSSGCTAVCCVITPSHFVCASVGDSRCVLGTSGGAVAMTEDHKPSNPDERVRVEAAGGFVMDDRVNGELAMSRALGDFRYKQDANLSDREQQVICYPDVCVQKRSAKDEVLLLACDGVWDVISNEDAVEYLTNIVFEGDSSNGAISAEEAAESLLDLSLHEGSTDNISAVIIKFKK